MSIRFNEIAYSPLVTCLVILFFVSYIYAQQCEQSSKAARFNCHPEDNPTQDKCEARKCCWRPILRQSNLTASQDPDVPFCYYPSDFPTYEVTSNETTDFGQRFQLYKSQAAFMPLDILNLTVELLYESEQRFRIKIFDPRFDRYEVPLQVPEVQKRANITDYEVDVESKPFAIIVTRKSTGVTL